MLLNEKYVLNARPEFEINIKLLYLIVHFEKGNTELLPSLIKSLHHDLDSKSRMNKFANILLDFLEKGALKIKSKKELISGFKKIKKEFLLLENDPSENTPFKEFDYISWIESKIENKSFAEIVKEKQA